MKKLEDTLQYKVFMTMPLGIEVELKTDLLPCFPRYSYKQVQGAIGHLTERNLVEYNKSTEKYKRIKEEYSRNYRKFVYEKMARPKIDEPDKKPGEVIIRRPKGTNGSALAPDLPKNIDDAADSVLEAVDHLITLVRQEMRKAPDVDLKAENERLKSIIKDKLNIN